MPPTSRRISHRVPSSITRNRPFQMKLSTFQSAALYPDADVRGGTWYTGRYQSCVFTIFITVMLAARRGEVVLDRRAGLDKGANVPITSLAMNKIDSISSLRSLNADMVWGCRQRICFPERCLGEGEGDCCSYR